MKRRRFSDVYRDLRSQSDVEVATTTFNTKRTQRGRDGG